MSTGSDTVIPKRSSQRAGYTTVRLRRDVLPVAPIDHFLTLHTNMSSRPVVITKRMIVECIVDGLTHIIATDSDFLESHFGTQVVYDVL